MSAPLLAITGLHVSVLPLPGSGKEATEVVRGVDLTIAEGEVHTIMGPNGSGKSTLVNALMGHPAYSITAGEVQFRGKDLLAMEPHERSLTGLFLAFQYPREISGVTLRSFLLAAHRARAAADPAFKRLSPLEFANVLTEEMRNLHMDPAFAQRSINKGFSGGEKKKAEVLQMTILQPTLALLDETDSGLDVDALKIVAEGVKRVKDRGQRTEDGGRRTGDKGQGTEDGGQRTEDGGRPSVLLVTHYARILRYIQPDCVHVMVKGKIVQSGGMELAEELERSGYAPHGADQRATVIPLES